MSIIKNLQFDGPEGERFKREAATFCAKHQLALEALKERRRKDQKLNNFLNESEGNPVCRRLQLKVNQTSFSENFINY